MLNLSCLKNDKLQPSAALAGESSLSSLPQAVKAQARLRAANKHANFFIVNSFKYVDFSTIVICCLKKPIFKHILKILIKLSDFDYSAIIWSGCYHLERKMPE